MSTVEKAVFAQYGVKLGPSPGDGKYRLFRIDQLRNGYLIKLKDAAVFGSVIDSECFVWEFGEFWPVTVGVHRDSRDIQYEWKIWRIAQALIERGEKLSRDDLERLALAVQRLEAWL